MDLSKILMFYLCMAIAVSFFFPSVVLPVDETTSILGIFDVSYNSTTNEVYMGNSASFTNSDLNTGTSTETGAGGMFQNIVDVSNTYFQSFIDGLQNVWGVLKIFKNFLFSPITFVADPNLMGGAPVYIRMIFALPLILLALLEFVKFIAGRLSS